MNRALLSIIAIGLSTYLGGQASLFSDLSGSALEAEVIANYKPKFVEVLPTAKHILLTDIFNYDQSIRTFYTDTDFHLPEDEKYPAYYLSRPSTPRKSVHIDHIYPSTKGAKSSFGNAYSDLYNLIPVRGDLVPRHRTVYYKNISDQDTEHWVSSDREFKSTKYLSNETIVEYNEFYKPNSRELWIEPAEHLKGDVARSIFYFYTMYRDAAVKTDPQYFDSMRTDLCKWHQTDAVDKSERTKNRRIALHQDNKVNPFILDHTLADRMYCNNDVVDAQNHDYAFLNTANAIKDFDPHITTIRDTHNQLDISNIKPGMYSLRIFAENGQKLYHIDESLDYFNTINLWNVKTGRFFVHLFNLDTGQKYSDVLDLVETK
jgi:hypothetical protein